LTFDLRKFAVLSDIEKMGRATAKEIAQAEGAKHASIGSRLQSYCKWGYIQAIGKAPPKDSRGQHHIIYELTEKGYETLSKMKNLVAAGFFPNPYKYKLPHPKSNLMKVNKSSKPKMIEVVKERN